MRTPRASRVPIPATARAPRTQSCANPRPADRADRLPAEHSVASRCRSAGCGSRAPRPSLQRCCSARDRRHSVAAPRSTPLRACRRFWRPQHDDQPGQNKNAPALSVSIGVSCICGGLEHEAAAFPTGVCKWTPESRVRAPQTRPRDLPGLWEHGRHSPAPLGFGEPLGEPTTSANHWQTDFFGACYFARFRPSIPCACMPQATNGERTRP